MSYRPSPWIRCRQARLIRRLPDPLTSAAAFAAESLPRCGVGRIPNWSNWAKISERDIRESNSYLITVAAPTPAANLTITATYQLGGTESLKCNVFTIDGRGVKTSGPDTDC